MLVTNLTSSLLTLDGYSISANGQYDLTNAPGPVLYAAWRSNLVSIPTGLSLLNNGGQIILFPPFASGTDTSVAAVLGYTPLPSTTPFVASFNGRGGTVSLSSGDVTGALGFNPASIGGSATQTFNAASAISDAQVIPYSQLYQMLGAEMPSLGSSIPQWPTTSTLGSAPRGWVMVSGAGYTDSPLASSVAIYGMMVTRNSDVTNSVPASSTTAWYNQELYLTTGQKYRRINTNGTGWAAWQLAVVQDLSGVIVAPVFSSTGTGFYAANNTGLNVNDSSGNPHLIWQLSSDNYPTWINALGTHVRIVNQAYTSEIFTCDNSGNVTATGNIAGYSDERFKKDWEPVVADYVLKLANVLCGTFTRTDDAAPGLRQAGVGAQSFKRILPEVVNTDQSGYMTLAYGQAALVSAVELAKYVLGLEHRIAQLESIK